MKREVWEGKVPVCFSVAGGEVGLNMAAERVIPEPCYVSGWSAYVRPIPVLITWCLGDSWQGLCVLAAEI